MSPLLENQAAAEATTPSVTARGLAVPLAVLEVAAGLILAGGGVWTPGARPWLLLAAVGLVSAGPWLATDAQRRPRQVLRCGGRALAVSNVPLWLALLGVTLASLTTWWAGPWTLALAGLARTEDGLRGTRWAGPGTSALYHSGTLLLGLAVGAGGALPSHQIGAFVLFAAYAVLTFAAAALAPLEPGTGRPAVPAMAALLAICWILLALPLTPFLSAADLVGRVVALTVVVWRGLDVFRAVFRLGEESTHDERSWSSLVRPTPILFLAGLTLLSWTNLAALAAATMIAAAMLLREGQRVEAA